MWKKQDEEADMPSRTDTTSKPDRRPATRSPEGRATIGRSITIRGEVIGEEDLLIEGKVEGSVDLKQHAVTVGSEGEVTADIQGRVVTIEGHVEGDLHGDERVILRESAHVIGDIKAPRVTLEDGAHFRGTVEMTKEGQSTRSTSSSSTSSASSSTSSSGTGSGTSAAGSGTSSGSSSSGSSGSGSSGSGAGS